MRAPRIHRLHRSRFERIKRAIDSGTYAATDRHADKVERVYVDGVEMKDVKEINVREGWARVLDVGSLREQGYIPEYVIHGRIEYSLAGFR